LPALIPTIGLEVHCQLKTQSKMFCACPITHGAEPNSAVCPVCLGHPGALPVVNDEAVRLAVRAGMAVGCTINDRSVFARKHYFYPDLPKGYQISQFDQPICSDGRLSVLIDGERSTFEIERIHMEEDAGKLTHDGDRSLVDFNRGGTPLVEIVGRPDLPSPEIAEAWMRMLHRVMTAAGVTHGDMEKGHFRCDANVSLAPAGGPLGTRVEIKNINSFRFLSKAIHAEIARQRRVLESGKRIVQSTRSWTGSETVSLRSKEDAADYRYFPDPDLGPVPVSQADHSHAEAALSGIPLDLHLLDEDHAEITDFKARFALPDADAVALLADATLRAYFESAVEAGGTPKAMANWTRGPLARWLNTHSGATLSLEPAELVHLEQMVGAGQITRDVARSAVTELCDSGGSAAQLIADRGWLKVEDQGEITAAVSAVMTEHKQEVARFRAGEARLFGFFIGAVMRRFDGRADATEIRAALKAALEGSAEEG